MTDTVGTSAMVALAVLVGSATLFAVKIMFCCVVRVVGTEYIPLGVMLP